MKDNKKPFLLLIVLLNSVIFFVSGDDPSYKLPVRSETKTEAGKNLARYIKKIVSKKNLPKLLGNLHLLPANEKANILYLLLIFKDKFSKRTIRRWVKDIIRTPFIEKNALETFSVVFIDKNICARKIFIKLQLLNAKEGIISEYKRKCRY